MDIDTPIQIPNFPPSPIGHPKHKIKLPAQYKDYMLSLPTPVEFLNQPDPDPDPESETEPQTIFRTKPNPLGMYKIYAGHPSRDPDGEISINDLCDLLGLLVPSTENIEMNLPSPPTSTTTPTVMNRIYPLVSFSFLFISFHFIILEDDDDDDWEDLEPQPTVFNKAWVEEMAAASDDDDDNDSESESDEDGQRESDYDDGGPEEDAPDEELGGGIDEPGPEDADKTVGDVVVEAGYVQL